ncbi:vacuolar sorting-associated 13A [Brachionus plicatilis]|uniref:Vacuolar sorting-associated 13A n=1 Tax=Brachionus plicatilis TaxID=10195 RepID=A0A3M7PZ37_BRAPC|nr:vacuolar sorting-associated 13A [Brachionus plicatilis]
MVFESVVAYFLDKYLSNYIEDLDSSNLKIGIWNGNVTLENLHLKSNALDELELPIRIVFGHLKKLTLKIPWKSLYTESVKASIDGLTILIAPKSSFSFDEESEKKESRDRKLKEVKRLIELEKSRAKSKPEQDDDTDQKSDSFGERIQMQVIRNLELEIKNIHVRYEDDFSKPEHPFSAGVTLNSIEIKTTDENWQPTYLKENKTLVNKIASLVSYAIYCNSDDKLLKSENKDYSIRVMQNMISDFTETKYILKPLSLSSKAILNMKPKQNEFSSPLFDFTVILESISLNLNRLQYLDIVNMLGTIDYMAQNTKYQKYRIKDNKKKKETQLWQFAFKAIYETVVKPKKEEFKWTRIKLISKTRKEYVNILKKKAKNPKLSAFDKEIEKNCEEILDVFNLMLARKQADVEIARLAKQEASSKSSWWGWLSSSSSQTDQKDKAEELTLSLEEKEKLYDAIGYSEESSFSEYPENFIGFRLKFLLKKFELELINAEYKDENRSTTIAEYSLVHLVIENMEADLMQYPVTKGFRINSSIKSINLKGSSIDSNIAKFELVKEEDRYPMLIEADLKQEKFLEFSYGFNPKDQSCNKRLSLSSKSLRFTYHAITVNNIVYFFRSSESTSKIRLKNAALKSINKVKQRSILYMKNNLQNIQQMEVNVEIFPSYLIVPKKGNIQNSGELIYLNFGHLSFKSEPREEISFSDDVKFDSANDGGGEEDQILNKTKENEELERSKSQVFQASYWKYKIQLTRVQILLINELKQIEIVTNKTADEKILESLYILTPLDISLNIHQCVYTDDVTLPALKVFGNLPLIELNLTDLKIEQIILLFLSIPFPDQKELSKFQNLDTSFMDEVLEESQELPISEIDEIPFQTHKKKFDFLSFNIKSFGTKLLQKTFDTCIDIYLKEIKCEYGLFKDTNGSKLYLLNSSKRDPKCNLIDIKMTITDSQSPTLKLLHDNVLVNVKLDLCAIDLTVNLVALKNMMDFLRDFQNRLSSSKYLNFQKEIENFERIIKKDHQDNRPLLHDERIKELLNKIESNKDKKKKALIDFDLVETKVEAKFDGLRARLGTKLNSIGKTAQYDVNFSLNSISVIDLEQDVVYNKILCPQEESQNLVSIDLTMYNPPKTPLSQVSKLAAQYQKEIFYFKNYMDQNHFDLSVKARIMKLKMIFLYANLNKLMVKYLTNTQVSFSLGSQNRSNMDTM